MLYGLAISQSDCRKTGSYQLPFNNILDIFSVLTNTLLLFQRSGAKTLTDKTEANFDNRLKHPTALF